MSSIKHSPALSKTESGTRISIRALIGRKIKSRRRELGKTQLDLSEMLGLNASLVQRYERGSAPILVERLCEIASALKVPVAYLVDEADTRHGEQTKARSKTTPKEGQKPEGLGTWIKGGGIVQGAFCLARAIANAVNDNW